MEDGPSVTDTLSKLCASDFSASLIALAVISSTMLNSVVRALSLACSQTSGVNILYFTRKWDFSCRYFMKVPYQVRKFHFILSLYRAFIINRC